MLRDISFYLTQDLLSNELYGCYCPEFGITSHHITTEHLYVPMNVATPHRQNMNAYQAGKNFGFVLPWS